LRRAANSDNQKREQEKKDLIERQKKELRALEEKFQGEFSRKEEDIHFYKAKLDLLRKTKNQDLAAVN